MLRKIFVFLILVILWLASACTLLNTNVRDYLEYWTGILLVQKVYVVSPYVTINSIENINAVHQVQIGVEVSNNQEYELLSKPAGENNCFHITDLQGNNACQSVSGVQTSVNSISIFTELLDDFEGEELILKGNLFPKGMPQLWDSSVFDFHFIQNSPPDAVSELTNEKQETIERRHFVYFKIPDQNKKRNQDISFEIECFLNEGGTLVPKWTSIVTKGDNKINSKDEFVYFFAEQEDYLYYEYSVKVIDSTGLCSAILKTDSKKEIKDLQAPGINFGVDFNGFTDEAGYKYIELEENDGNEVAYSIIGEEETDRISGSVDGIFYEGNHRGTLPLGAHTISLKVSRDSCRPAYSEVKVKVVQSICELQLEVSGAVSLGIPDDPNVMPGAGYDSYEFELNETSDNFPKCRLKQTVSDIEVFGTIDNKPFLGYFTDYPLELGEHHIEYTVKRPYYKDRSFSKTVYVAGNLSSPVFEFGEGNDVINSGLDADENEILKFSYKNYDELAYTVKAKNAGCLLKLKIDGQEAAESGNMDFGVHVLTATVSMENCKTITVEKKVNVQMKKITLRINTNSNSGSADTWLNFIQSGFGNSTFDLKGQIYYDNQLLYSYEESKYSVSSGNNYLRDYNSAYSEFSSPEERMYVTTTRLRRNVGGGGDENFGKDVNASKSLKEVKENNWQMDTGTITDSKNRKVRFILKFIVEEES